MNSKFGNLAKPAPQLWDNEMVPKQLNLNKLSDAGSSKDVDVRRSQKPNFEFVCVYMKVIDMLKKISLTNRSSDLRSAITCSMGARECVFFFILLIWPLYSAPLLLHGPQLSLDLMRDLKREFNVEVLVETGTWGAETAKNGAAVFQEVYTVELDHDLFEKAARKLAPLTNVHPFEGHSPLFLKKVVPEIKGRILFWLDAHWCGENTARFTGNTPIRDELLAIKELGLKTAVILIDDIRCFHNLPEEVVGYGGYPLLDEIKELVLSINPAYEFWLLGDMAIAFLKEDHQDISPLVRGCTASRLFKENDDINILEMEKLLIDHCNDSDSFAIDFLQGLVIPSTEFITYHLSLWKGLIEFGRENFFMAGQSFEKVLRAGYRHWRIYWYLARVEQALGHFEKAHDLFVQASILREKK